MISHEDAKVLSALQKDEVFPFVLYNENSSIKINPTGSSVSAWINWQVAFASDRWFYLYKTKEEIPSHHFNIVHTSRV